MRIVEEKKVLVGDLQDSLRKIKTHHDAIFNIIRNQKTTSISFNILEKEDSQESFPFLNSNNICAKVSNVGHNSTLPIDGNYSYKSGQSIL